MRETFEERRPQVVPLIAIIKLMEHPNPSMMHLLEAIIQKYPGGFGFGVTKISCSCTAELHSVSTLGFLLLEEVELACGSAHQEILQLLRVLDEPCLAALASRELRQDGKMTRFLSAHFYPFYFFFHRVVL